MTELILTDASLRTLAEWAAQRPFGEVFELLFPMTPQARELAELHQEHERLRGENAELRAALEQAAGSA